MQTAIDEQTEHGAEASASDDVFITRTHNDRILAQIETGLVELETALQKLDSLIAKETRLAGELQKVSLEEAAVLKDETLAEKDAVKKLITVRATKDVQTARLEAAKQRTFEQTEFTLELGAVVRRTLARAANEILMARQARIQRLLDDLLGSQYDSGLSLSNDFIAKASRPVVEAQQFVNFVNQGVRPTQAEELETLRTLPRTWFDRLVSYVNIELQVQLVG
jgi:hypothetical protein